MLIEHGGDFEVLAIALRALLAMLPPAYQTTRRSFIQLARRKWSTLNRDDQDRWLDRLENVRVALTTRVFKNEAKLLELIDSVFAGPPPSDNVSSVATAGILMRLAYFMWKPFSDLSSSISDLRLGEEAVRRMPINPENFKILLHSYRWTLAGFPVIKISPKFAAAAMCSTLSPEVQADLRAPWKAFVIELPKDPVLYHWPFGAKKEATSVAHVLVLWSDRLDDDRRHWSLWLSTNPEIPNTNRVNLTTTELCSDHLSYGDEEMETFWGSIENRDERALMLGGRIVSSTICALTNQNTVRNIDQSDHDAWKKHPVPPTKMENVRPLVFQITSPVTINLVDRVKDYQLHHSSNKDWKLKVRMVVGGHWKMQVCGPGRTGRVKIWIQPYERGPKGAPLAVRDHVLKDTWSQSSPENKT